MRRRLARRRVGEAAALAVDSLRTRTRALGARHRRHRHRHRHGGARRLGARQRAQPDRAALPRSRHRERLRVPPHRRSLCHRERARSAAASRWSSRSSPTFERLGTAVRDVGAQVIVPTTRDGEVLVARAGGNESDTVLVEGASPTLFDIVGAEFARGRPFTELEDRQRRAVAVVGASLSAAPSSAATRRSARR